jgi:hypothetical protein
MPIARIPVITFLTVQIRVYTCGHHIVQLLHDLMGSIPLTLRVVPQSPHAGFQPARTSVLIQTSHELLVVHPFHQKSDDCCIIPAARWSKANEAMHEYGFVSRGIRSLFTHVRSSFFFKANRIQDPKVQNEDLQPARLRTHCHHSSSLASRIAGAAHSAGGLVRLYVVQKTGDGGSSSNSSSR